MKVYVKRYFANSKFVNLFSWILVSFFAIASAFALFNLVIGKGEYSSIIELIGTILLGGGILIAYIWMFIKPTKYKLRLVYKIEEEYNGKRITSMEFSGLVTIFNFKTLKKFNCYAIGENSLEINKEYNVIISRFEGFPIRVEEI